MKGGEMRIIKEGKLPPPWSRETRCFSPDPLRPGCGSVLAVEASDLYVIKKNYGYATEDLLCFECPFCGVENHLSHDFYPGKVSGLSTRKQWQETRQKAPKGSWL
jgi:hypothetical protein